MTSAMIRSVLRSYRDRRAAGELDHPAFEAAVSLYLELNPEATRSEASLAVSRIVHESEMKVGIAGVGLVRLGR